MNRSIILALLVVAAPVGAWAQMSSKGTGTQAVPGPSSNLNNPQAQANMAGQPALAHTVPSDGDAKSIPTPVIDGHPFTKTPMTPAGNK